MFMRRREFIELFGGVLMAWPLPALAQQQQSMPVIGFLGSPTAPAYAPRLIPFRQTLKALGYVEGENIKIEYRWAEDRYDRLPGLAAELVRDNPSVIIAAGGAPTALAAKNATSTIPIVFQNGSDPVKLGLVASLNRPGGNITGVTNVSVETAAKRFELLAELVPAARTIGWMMNPANPNRTTVNGAVERAGKSLGRGVVIAEIGADSDVDAAFAKLVQLQIGGLVLSADPIFSSLTDRIIQLSAKHSVPTMFPFRESVIAGGLVSYGANFTDVYRQVAVYTARILKGEKPAELPVVQSTKYELVLNLNTAKALGLEVPMSFLMRINDVIE